MSVRPPRYQRAGGSPETTIAWKAMSCASKASATDVHTSSFRLSPCGMHAMVAVAAGTAMEPTIAVPSTTRISSV